MPNNFALSISKLGARNVVFCLYISSHAHMRLYDHEERSLFRLPNFPVLLADIGVILERVTRLNDRRIDTILDKCTSKTVSSVKKTRKLVMETLNRGTGDPLRGSS